MAVNLFELLNDLEAKAKAATPDQVDSIIKGALNGSGRQIWHMRGAPAFEEQAKRDVEYYAACSPDTVLALITALREAGEALKRIENPVLRGRPSYADWELRLIARDWRAKYAKGEK